MLLDQFIGESLIAAIRNHTLFIKHCEDASWSHLQEIYAVLVVREIERIPGDALSVVKRLLQLKNELVEELLQPDRVTKITYH